MTLLDENQMDINVFNNKLVNEIIQSAEEIIPKTTGIRRIKNVPWWNNDCKAAVKARNKVLRQLKKLNSMDAMIKFKCAQALVRKTIKTQAY